MEDSRTRKERLQHAQDQYKKVNVSLLACCLVISLRKQRSDASVLKLLLSSFLFTIKKHHLQALLSVLFKVEDLFLLFAKKASAFNSWFENAEEDLTDPVRCNSVEEIRVSFTAHVNIPLFS